MRRMFAAVALAVLVVLGMAPPAEADEAVPSRYRTEVASITPEVDTIEVALIGGDNFVELTVEPGHEVVVLGYEREPYLRFDADGTVSENRRSGATYLDDTRYGSVEVPDDLSPDDEPEWVEIADDGRWAWRDHRAHWLSDTPPLGLAPGDQVLDNTLPLEVDGTPVTVRLVSNWQPDPSRLPVDIAAVLGIALGLTAMTRRGIPGLPVLIAGASALVIGVWQVMSLPPEASPGPLVWVLPAIAVVAGAAATALRTRGWSNWIAIAGAIIVTVWAGGRADVIRYAVLPTDAPYWLDRAVTAGAAVTGVVTVFATLIGMLRRRRDAAASAAGPSGGAGARPSATPATKATRVGAAGPAGRRATAPRARR